MSKVATKDVVLEKSIRWVLVVLLENGFLVAQISSEKKKVMENPVHPGKLPSGKLT